MNTITYRVSQKKKKAQKPAASSQPPKPTPQSEAGPVSVPDETKAEASGVQNDVEVRVRFVRSEAEPHDNLCSGYMGDYYRTILMFPCPSQSQCHHGFVAFMQTLTVEHIEGAVSSCGRQCWHPRLFFLYFDFMRSRSYDGIPLYYPHTNYSPLILSVCHLQFDKYLVTNEYTSMECNNIGSLDGPSYAAVRRRACHTTVPIAIGSIPRGSGG